MEMCTGCVYMCGLCIEATHNYKLQGGTTSTSRTNNICMVEFVASVDYLPPLCTYRYEEFDQQKKCLSLNYRIAGNFREAEIFAIFAIKRQLAKICSRENFFLQKFLADELRTLSTVCLGRRSSKSTEKFS